MAATINGKKVLLNESILVDEGAIAKFSGSFPLTISAVPGGQTNVSVTLDPNGGFLMHATGFSLQTTDYLIGGGGTFQGKPFVYRGRVEWTSGVNGVPIYHVSITVFEA